MQAQPDRTDSASAAPAAPPTRSPLLRFIIDHPCTSMLVVVLLLGASILSISIRYIKKETMTVPDTVAMMGLSKRYYEEGQYDKAIEITRDLDQRNSAYWYSELTTGNALFKKGHLDLAENHFRKAVALNTNVPLPLLNLALTCFKQGKYDEARKYYTAVTEQFGIEYPDMSQRALEALQLISQTAGPGPE
jgi:tetratricopeptide (TPR) repeat protein